MIYIRSLNDTQFNQIMYTSDLFLLVCLWQNENSLSYLKIPRIKYHVPIQITNSMEKK